jgi:protein-tyrosine phosphatase
MPAIPVPARLEGPLLAVPCAFAAIATRRTSAGYPALAADPRDPLAPVQVSREGASYAVAVRRIPLEGATNLRDAGGYLTSKGAPLPWRQRFRAENLSRLTHADWDVLERLGISTVLDLRTKEEFDQLPTRAPASIEVLRLPIRGRLLGFDDPTQALLDARITTINLEDMRAMYREMVAQHGAELREAAALYRSHPTPLLVHCTAGKDRTGIVVALWQLAAGVNWADVVADYKLSSLFRTLQRFLGLGGRLRAAGIDPRGVHAYLSTHLVCLEESLHALGAIQSSDGERHEQPPWTLLDDHVRGTAAHIPPATHDPAS